VIDVDNGLTIGLSAYGNAVATRQALHCLHRSVRGDYEVILVDDCSPDDGAVYRVFEEYRRVHARTRIFRFDRNLEYSGSLNAILSHASGSRVLFLSNDIYVAPAYMREMLAVAAASPKHGIVRGCSNFVDNGRATHNVKPDAPIDSFEALSAFAQRVCDRAAGRTVRDDYLTGDAFLVRREVIDRIGTLDPLFYGYFADHDYGLRAQAAGFDLVLAQSAFAAHHRAANFEYLPPEEQRTKINRRMVRVVENWARFKLKYGLPVDLLYTSVNDIPWGELAGRLAPAAYLVAPGDYGRYEQTT
jgi:GT2 family glycosyltransferase